MPMLVTQTYICLRFMANCSGQSWDLMDVTVADTGLAPMGELGVPQDVSVLLGKLSNACAVLKLTAC